MLSMDLDDGAEKVTDSEMAAVLRECLGDKPKSASKKAAPPMLPQAPQAPPSPPKLPAALDTIGAKVDARVLEYQKAAVLANQDGRKPEALQWLRKSKQIAAQIEELLKSNFPPVEEATT